MNRPGLQELPASGPSCLIPRLVFTLVSGEMRSQYLLVTNLVSHHVHRLEVSALVDSAGGGGVTHAGDRGQPHHLGGDLVVPVHHVNVKSCQDDGMVPVEFI